MQQEKRTKSALYKSKNSIVKKFIPIKLIKKRFAVQIGNFIVTYKRKAITNFAYLAMLDFICCIAAVKCFVLANAINLPRSIFVLIFETPQAELE